MCLSTNTFRSLRDTSPIFCAAKHPVILRDTAGGEFHTFVLLLCLTPSPCGHGNTGGEDWKRHFMFWHKDSFVHFSSIVARHPAMPRDTAGRRVKESIWTASWGFLFVSWGSPYILPLYEFAILVIQQEKWQRKDFNRHLLAMLPKIYGNKPNEGHYSFIGLQ